MSSDEALRGRYVDVEGTRTYYETAGDPDATPVVLVHTAGAEGRQWRYVAPELAAAGYRPIVPDLPGHGKSYAVEWTPHSSIHEHAEFVWALAEALELESPAVVGCSIGGCIAIDLAVNHADDLRGVVALEGLARTEGANFQRLAHPHACPGWQDILDYSTIDATHDGLSPSRTEELKWQHRGSQRVATNDLQAWNDHDVLDEADRASCPTMVVRGTEDFYVPERLFERTVEAIPDCEAVVMEDTGHYPMMERPEETVDLVTGFLEGE